MNIVWGILLGCASVFSCIVDVNALTILTESAVEAVQLCLRMMGGYALFCGILSIVEACGGAAWLAHGLRTPLKVLFPGIASHNRAREAVSENLTANMLGLGNAATPAGLRAMHEMKTQNECVYPTDDMCMLLVINATGVQLVPTGVIALRAAAGSVSAASIVLPTLFATAVSTAVGVAVCLLCRRRG